MFSQDLIDVISSRLSKGESAADVKKNLLSQGWAESAVDSVLKEKLKQREPSVWERLPIYQHFLRWDAKSAELSGKVVFCISIVLILFVLLFSFILYKITDPFNLNGVSRDKERELVYTQLQSGLERYHNDMGMYPKSLSELVPKYITNVPNDPKSNRQYDYLMVGANSFKLCIRFETKAHSNDCINY